MSYTQTFGSGWTLTLDTLGTFAVARLVRGDKQYELITEDRTMLDLPGMGYLPTVKNSTEEEPWVIWSPADQSALYVWVCPYNTAMWTDEVRIAGGPN